MSDNPFKTKLNMQDGTISICDDNAESIKRFTCCIDEWPDIAESGQAEYERAKAIMGNPLLNTINIDIAMTNYYAMVADKESIAPSHLAMIKFYQNTLVMWRRLHDCLAYASDGIDRGVKKLAGPNEVAAEVIVLKECQSKLAAILEAHKHHMEE